MLDPIIPLSNTIQKTEEHKEVSRTALSFRYRDKLKEILKKMKERMRNFNRSSIFSRVEIKISASRKAATQVIITKSHRFWIWSRVKRKL